MPALKSSLLMCSLGVDSRNTVCQMPVQGVYQIIPPRVSVCFPRGIWILSVSVGS
jgi:hypothetical protein